MTSTTETPAPAKAAKAEASAPAEKKQCMCGLGTGKQCPALTLKSFAQGHDARMSGRVAQAVADFKIKPQQAEDLIRKAGGGDLLVGKMHRSAKLRIEQAKAKKAAADEKAAAAKAPKPAAAAKATTTATATGKEVPVKCSGRTYKAEVVKDAAGKLVARHVVKGENCDHELDI
jgi:hypothetical protein